MRPDPLVVQPTGPMVPSPYRVSSRFDELDDTVTLTLQPVGQPLEEPAPGQFNMLWAFGVGEAPISLAGVPAQGELMHTVRAVGAVTRALAATEVGDDVGVRGPYGVGWDVHAARGRDILVVAGGLGIAPIRPIVTEILANRDFYGMVTILLGARNPTALLYDAELADWAARDDLDVGITVDSADRSWRGDVGVVTRLVEKRTFDGARTTAFLCGPEVMMRFAAVSAVDHGLNPESVWLSLERNMHCAVGHCGHCQLGPLFLCKEGPVIAWPQAEPLMRVRER